MRTDAPFRVSARATVALALALLVGGCSSPCRHASAEPQWFQLRPDVEDAYGYTHAVRVGDRLLISGAVSMDDAGAPTAIGDIEQQMKNCYADLAVILEHYGCTFEDVVVENLFTTDMASLLQVAAHRATVYADRYPTGTWVEVKGLALPEFMVEIELEAHIPRR